MPRLTANHFAPELLELYDFYVHGKTYEAHVYPGTNHGFHNDSTRLYDEEAAELARERTVAWFRRYLGSRRSPPF